MSSSSPRTRWVFAVGLLIAAVVGGAAVWKSQETPEGRKSTQKSTSTKNGKSLTSESSPASIEGVVEITLAHSDRPETVVDRLIAKIDPAVDGWETEVLSDAAKGQLKHLAKLLEHSERITAEKLSPLVLDRFHCSSLRPETLIVANHDGLTVVRRADADQLAVGQDLADGERGPKRLQRASKQMAAAWKDFSDVRVTFKLFAIERSSEYFTTRAFLEVKAVRKSAGKQCNATWNCRWGYPDESSSKLPRLLRISLEQYEEVDARFANGRQFVDCTRSVMGVNACYAQQVLPGVDHWLARITKLHRFWKFGWHGVTLGDVNGDGLDDVYWPEAGGLPNRLFIQNPDGTLTDRSSEARVDYLEASPSALLIDLDNDGDQDLVIASVPRTVFMENDGHGRFTFRHALRTVADPFSMSAADFDADGDLDIYVCGYNREDTERNVVAPVPYSDANNGGRSVLLRNDGGFRFTDVTRQVGLEMNNRRFSLAVAWEDFDNDGDLDLYVANDYGRNNLYRNDGGRFVDVAPQAGVEDISSGMSVTWGDYDRDGRMDVYISNMFSAAANRVTYQRKFEESRSGGGLSQLRRMGRGNSLLAGRADGTFRDVSEPAGVLMGRWSWASRFADLNNDGWQDLCVANGFITSSKTVDL